MFVELKEILFYGLGFKNKAAATGISNERTRKTEYNEFSFFYFFYYTISHISQLTTHYSEKIVQPEKSTFIKVVV